MAQTHRSVDLAAFGSRVRARREALGLLQRALGALIGVSEPKTISAWEHGHAMPRGPRLVRLAEALGCAVDWLLYGDADDAGTEEVTDVRVVRAVREYTEADPTATLLTPEELASLRTVDFGPVAPTARLVREMALELLAQRR